MLKGIICSLNVAILFSNLNISNITRNHEISGKTKCTINIRLFVFPQDADVYEDEIVRRKVSIILNFGCNFVWQKNHQNVTEIMLDLSNCNSNEKNSENKFYLQGNVKQNAVVALAKYLNWSKINVLLLDENKSEWSVLLGNIIQEVSSMRPRIKTIATNKIYKSPASSVLLIASSDNHQLVEGYATLNQQQPLLFINPVDFDNMTNIWKNNSRVCVLASFDVAKRNFNSTSKIRLVVSRISEHFHLQFESSGLLESILEELLDSESEEPKENAVTIIKSKLKERQWLSCVIPNVNNDPNNSQLQLKTVGKYANNSFKIHTTPFASYEEIMENKTYVIGIAVAEPYSFDGTIGKDGYVENMTGMTIDMLDEISRRLKFKYKLMHPKDDFWGGINSDGVTWNGMIGDILNKKINFAVGPFTVTAIREAVIDFSFPFMEDGNAILIRKPRQQNSLFRVLRPFATESWGAIAGSMLLASFAVFMYSYLSPFSSWNLNLVEKSTDEVSFRENVWSSLGTLLQQGQDFFPAAASARVTLGVWWMVVVVLMAYYTADMIGYLTLYIPEKTVKNLEDITQQTAVKPLVISGTNVHTLFQKSLPGTDYYKIYQQLQSVPQIKTASEGLVLTKTGLYAFISDHQELLFQILSECNLRVLTEDIFNMATFAWPLPQNSPYKTLIDKEMRVLVETGLMERWIRKWWHSNKICATQSALSDAVAINLTDLLGTYIIMGIFYVTALTTLLIECIYCRLTLQHQINKVSEKN